MYEYMNKAHLELIIGLAVLCLVLLVCCAIFLCLYISQREKCKDVKNRKNKYKRESEEKTREIGELKTSVSNLEKKLHAFSQSSVPFDVSEIPPQRTNEEISREDYDSPQEQVEETLSPVLQFDIPKSKEVEYLYLKEAAGNKFSKKFTDGKNCYFRCWEFNGLLLFEFFGDQQKAIKNINAVFDNVCVISGAKPSGATTIINIEPGELDQNLRVIKMAKIKLE